MFAKLSKYKSINQKYNELSKQLAKLNFNYPDLIQSKIIAHRPNHKLYIGYTTYKLGNKFFCICITIDGFNDEIIHYDIANDDKPENIFKTLDQSLEYLTQYRNLDEETIIQFSNKWQFNSEIFRNICNKHNIKMSMSSTKNGLSVMPYVQFFGKFGVLFANYYNFNTSDDFKTGVIEFIEESNKEDLSKFNEFPYKRRAIRGWDYEPLIKKVKSEKKSLLDTIKQLFPNT